jgi:Ca2+ transporting ATPase
MTLFNEFNARKIHNERNIFDGIMRNKTFVLIWLGCLSMQVYLIAILRLFFKNEFIEVFL